MQIIELSDPAHRTRLNSASRPISISSHRIGCSAITGRNRKTCFGESAWCTPKIVRRQREEVALRCIVEFPPEVHSVFFCLNSEVFESLATLQKCKYVCMFSLGFCIFWLRAEKFEKIGGGTAGGWPPAPNLKARKNPFRSRWGYLIGE